MKSFGRRHFLKQSTFFTAGIGASLAAKADSVESARSLSRRPAASDRIRIACVGCGGMGRGDLAAFLRNDDVDCVAVCDVDEAQLAKAAELVNQARGCLPSTYTDFRRILDRNDVDALLVATPDHWHALPTVYACQRGLDVYVEKPLGKTISEGAAMLEAARRSGSVVQMGTQWRSAEHFRDAVSFVQSGTIGKVRLVRARSYLDWVGGIGNPPDGDPPEGVDYDMWLGPAPKRPFNPNRFHFNFRWFWDYAGGLMTDWGVHLLNICLWAMGYSMPLRVMCSGGKRVAVDSAETPDTQVAVYEFPEYTLVFEQEMLGGWDREANLTECCSTVRKARLSLTRKGGKLCPNPRRIVWSPRGMTLYPTVARRISVIFSTASRLGSNRLRIWKLLTSFQRLPISAI